VGIELAEVPDLDLDAGAGGPELVRNRRRLPARGLRVRRAAAGGVRSRIRLSESATAGSPALANVV
jgi:hypothetical protein